MAILSAWKVHLDIALVLREEKLLHAVPPESAYPRLVQYQ